VPELDQLHEGGAGSYPSLTVYSQPDALDKSSS
jgi:hypothetical protein